MRCGLSSILFDLVIVVVVVSLEFSNYLSFHDTGRLSVPSRNYLRTHNDCSDMNLCDIAGSKKKLHF